MAFTVAIIGRPNVGKSTLFNRLAGKRLAIVDDRPGVTRDRRMAPAKLFDLAFTLIDTAGLEEAFDDSIEGRMRRQTEQAVGDADLILMVTDGRAGVTGLDRHFADWLRRLDRPCRLLVNKCEGQAAEAGLHEAWGLGLGAPIGVSAEHGQGLDDLYEILKAAMADAGTPAADADPADAEGALPEETDPEAIGSDDDGRTIQLAIVGRPNVGKSTLVNAVLGQDRVMTGPEPGVTRDAIQVGWTYGGRDFTLVDTAGMRKKARIEDRIERMSVQDTLYAIRMAQVTVLVLDADAVLDRQDLTIARHIADEGRAMVVAVNKWDRIDQPQRVIADLRHKLEHQLAQLKGVPFVPISALKGRGLDRLMDQVLAIYRIWTTRIGTGPLNRWLAGMLEAHPPPAVSGRRLKIRYITQIKSRPPTYALFTTRPDALPDSYLRYLTNGLREAFGLDGVPLRISLRKGKNPYVDGG